MAAISSKRLLRPFSPSSPHPRLSNITFRQSSRSFHASSPRAFDPLLGFPEALLTTLHSTDLPWAVVLPAAAVSVRLTTFVLFQYRARRAAQRRSLLQPLLTAFAYGHVLKYGPSKNTMEAVQKNTKNIQDFWAMQRWREFVSLLQLPILLGMLESIRRMSGMGIGAWGQIGKLAASIKSALLPTAVASSIASQTSSLDTHVDTTWTTEGPWWCTDLTQTDPTFILPVAIPMILYLSVSTRGTELAMWQQVAQRDKVFKIGTLTRTVKVVALAMCTITPSMPAGILWYWFWSSSTALVLNTLTEAWMPVPKRKVAARPFVQRKRVTALARRRSAR